MPKLFRESDLADQSGKTFCITGANTGVGFEAARALALKGGHVWLACRSADKARAAISKIKAGRLDAQIDFIQLDLNDLASVKNAVAQIETIEKLDVLINNAGIMGTPHTLTKDGFESHFGVNHLAHFALVGHLAAKIKKDGTRIIALSSLVHKTGQIDFDDPHAQNGYVAIKRYQMSKLANLLFAFELDRRLRRTSSEAISLACHPGIAYTQIARYMPQLVRFGAPVLGVLFNNAAQGAWPILLAATCPHAKGGDYFGPSQLREMSGPAASAKPARKALNEETAARLWEMSVELTGVDPQI